ncbi:hypothetical protein HMI49_17320 [Corallococcus exercitus]|uniref:histidine kinase n=1 Tax=Corallococcus exercitus TaxID=2316736 RepID=A0A7Y4KJT0_9BACT|nr:7TM diverse intracellular signaling domain-containing protein [Corallococcus exercitus]NOK34962.1 hypothetical protein [Corallococcus exercitus]
MTQWFRPQVIALLLFLAGGGASLAAPPDVVVDGTQDLLLVGQNLSVLEDDTQALTIEDVSRPEFADRFIRSTHVVPTHGYSRSVFWARFSYLEKDLPPGHRWFLLVKRAFLEHVDVYFQLPDGSFDGRRAGTQVPWAQREVPHWFPTFHLPGATLEPATVYIRFQTQGLMEMPVTLLTGDRLAQETAASLVPWWIYVGILSSMVLFNTILYFILKDRAYLYYILYIIFFGLFTGMKFQAVGYVFFPEGGSWLSWVMPAFAHLGCFFIALFTRSFLNTRQMAPLLDRLVLGLAAVSGFFALLSPFIPYRISEITANILVLAYGPLLLVVPVVVWRRGFQPARFFIAGWSVLIAGGVLLPFINQGWLPSNIVPRQVTQLGSAIEMILFALALASRINEAKKESEAAKRRALEGEIHRLRNIELRQANEEILRKQAQLVQAEKMASLGQLTTGIAHEIKNPLNFINNFSLSLVAMTDELEQEVKALPSDRQTSLMMIASDCKIAAQKIAEHGGRADGIVRGMLDHAAVRPGERRMTDLNRLIEEHLGLVHGAWGQQLGVHVSVERAFEPGLLPVEVIPQELGRVLLNLLNNAFHAVGARHKKGLDGYVPAIRISTHGQGEQVEIRIEDNGTGIPAAVRDRIFEPFFTTKPPGEGVGLGLSLSYGIVTQRHGGRLVFESTENQGTTFVIALPARRESEPSSAGGGGALAT